MKNEIQRRKRQTMSKNLPNVKEPDYALYNPWCLSPAARTLVLLAPDGSTEESISRCPIAEPPR